MQVKELRRAYYAAVSYMDSQVAFSKSLALGFWKEYSNYVSPQVGRVLGAVEDAGLGESTVVMFVGDHGYQVGVPGYQEPSHRSTIADGGAHRVDEVQQLRDLPQSSHDAACARAD